MVVLRQFLIVLVLMVVIDFLWIGLFMNRFYLEQFGPMARIRDGKIDVVVWSALLVYVFFAAGVTFLVLPLAGGNVLTALGYGALLGLTVYGVYDFTNHATLKHWPLALMATDVAWGTFLCGTCAALTTWVSERFF